MLIFFEDLLEGVAGKSLNIHSNLIDIPAILQDHENRDNQLHWRSAYIYSYLQVTLRCISPLRFISIYTYNRGCPDVCVPSKLWNQRRWSKTKHSFGIRSGQFKSSGILEIERRPKIVAGQRPGIQ